MADDLPLKKVESDTPLPMNVSDMMSDFRLGSFSNLHHEDESEALQAWTEKVDTMRLYEWCKDHEKSLFNFFRSKYKQIKLKGVNKLLRESILLFIGTEYAGRLGALKDLEELANFVQEWSKAILSDNPFLDAFVTAEIFREIIELVDNVIQDNPDCSYFTVGSDGMEYPSLQSQMEAMHLHSVSLRSNSSMAKEKSEEHLIQDTFTYDDVDKFRNVHIKRMTTALYVKDVKDDLKDTLDKARQVQQATRALLSGGILDPEANRDFATRMSTFYSNVNSFSESKKLFETKVRKVSQRSKLKHLQENTLAHLVEFGEKLYDKLQKSKQTEDITTDDKEKLDRLYRDFTTEMNEIANLDFQKTIEKASRKQVEELIVGKSEGVDIESLSERWEDVFGVEFQEHKFKEFLKKINHEGDEFDYNVVQQYLEYEQEVDPHEVIGYIHDQKRLRDYGAFLVNKGFSFCFFICLFLLFISYLLKVNGVAPERFFQSEGVTQVLIRSINEDYQYEDINTVGRMWHYFSTVLLPFAYGAKEYETMFNTYFKGMEDELEMSDKDLESAVRNFTGTMNPYLLGGIRFRQIRYQEMECEEPGDDNPLFQCVAHVRTYEDEETSAWTRFEKVDPINSILYHQSQEELGEQPWIRGHTQLNIIKGHGYVWTLPNANTTRTCIGEEECSKCACTGPMVDKVDENCYYTNTMTWRHCQAQNEIDALRRHFFIDSRTRVLFVDLNFYQPSVRMHTLARLVFEFKNGVIYPTWDIQTVNFFQFNDPSSQALFGIYAIFLLVFVGRHFFVVWRYMRVLGPPCCVPKHCYKLCTCREVGNIPVRLAQHEMVSHLADQHFKCCLRILHCTFKKESTVNVEEKYEEIALNSARLSFLKLDVDDFMPQNPSVLHGQLVIPFIDTTGDKILLRQYLIKRVVQLSIQDYINQNHPDLESNEVTCNQFKVVQTDYGGVTAKITIHDMPFEMVQKLTKNDITKNISMQTWIPGGSIIDQDTHVGSAHDPNISRVEDLLEEPSDGMKKEDGVKFSQHSTVVALDGKNTVQSIELTKTDSQNSRAGQLVLKPSYYHFDTMQHSTYVGAHFDEIYGDELYAHIADELEENLDTDPLLCNAKILRYSKLPYSLRWFLGSGIWTFYHSFWFCLDGILAVLFTTHVIVHLLIVTNDELKDLHTFVDTNNFKSFRAVQSLFNYEKNFMFGVAFASCIRLLSGLFGANHHAQMFWDTLNNAMSSILSFFLIIVFLTFTFALCGWILFSSELYEFRSIWNAWGFCFYSAVSDLRVQDLQRVSMSGTVFYLLWWLFIPFIFLNIMIAVLVDSWIKVMREDEVTRRPQWFQNVQNVWTYSIPQKIRDICSLGKKRKEDNASIKRSNGLVQNPRQWRSIYPAGCPRRKLENFLISNFNIADREIGDIVKCVDKDEGGTISWQEIQKVLLDIQPTLEGRGFTLNRNTIDKIDSLKHEVHGSNLYEGGDSDSKIESLNSRMDRIEKRQDQIFDKLDTILARLPS